MGFGRVGSSAGHCAESGVFVVCVKRDFQQQR